MKTLIIYATITGNTPKIAKPISRVLKAKLVKVENVKIKDIKKYDLIGFGSGIYAFRHHRNLLRLAEKLPFLRKKAFVFSSRGGGPATIYHYFLKKRLKRKGFKIIDEFSCKGFDYFGPLKLFGGLNKGRPNKKDIKAAESFAKRLKSRL